MNITAVSDPANAISQMPAANNRMQPHCSFLTKIPPEIRVIICDFYIVDCLFERGPQRIASNAKRPGTQSCVLDGVLHNDNGLAAPLHYSQRLSTPVASTCRKVALELRPMLPAYRSMTVHVRPTPQLPPHYFFICSRWFFAIQRSTCCSVDPDCFTAVRHLHVRVIIAANRNEKLRVKTDWAEHMHTIEDLAAGSQSTLRHVFVELCTDKSWTPHAKTWAGEDGPFVDVEFLCIDAFLRRLPSGLPALRRIDLHGIFHSCWIDRLVDHYPEVKIERGKAYRRRVTRKYDDGADLELCA